MLSIVRWGLLIAATLAGVGVAPAQNPDAGTNDGEGEQRSHIDQSCELIDGQQCGKKRNNCAYDYVRYPGRAEFGMNGRSPFP